MIVVCYEGLTRIGYNMSKFEDEAVSRIMMQ